MSDSTREPPTLIDPELLLFHFGEAVERTDIEEKLDTRIPNVYVLSIDLCSYTAFVRETPELKVATEIMRSFCDRCRLEVLNSGGAVDRVTGDAIMAFWGLSKSVDYRVPLDVSFRLIEIAEEISEQWQEQIDHVVSPRGASAGLTYGEVAFIRVPSAYPSFSMLGDPVNLAARLEGAAPPGALYASNRFRHLIRQDEDAGMETGLVIEPVDDGDNKEGILLKNLGSVHAFHIRRR